MNLPKVLNKRKYKTLGDDDVYVGRPTVFGNPFTMRSEVDRKRVIAEYAEWLKAKPQLIARIKRDLKGKNLVCWCAPKRCHADILLRIANE